MTGRHSFVLRIEHDFVSAELALLIGRLATAGCADALLDTDTPGLISMTFTRDGDSLERAVMRAVAEVRTVVPETPLGLLALPDDSP